MLDLVWVFGQQPMLLASQRQDCRHSKSYWNSQPVCARDKHKKWEKIQCPNHPPKTIRTPAVSNANSERGKVYLENGRRERRVRSRSVRQYIGPRKWPCSLQPGFRCRCELGFSQLLLSLSSVTKVKQNRFHFWLWNSTVYCETSMALSGMRQEGDTRLKKQLRFKKRTDNSEIQESAVVPPNLRSF